MHGIWVQCIQFCLLLHSKQQTLHSVLLKQMVANKCVRGIQTRSNNSTREKTAKVQNITLNIAPRYCLPSSFSRPIYCDRGIPVSRSLVHFPACSKAGTLKARRCISRQSWKLKYLLDPSEYIWVFLISKRSEVTELANYWCWSQLPLLVRTVCLRVQVFEDGHRDPGKEQPFRIAAMITT